MCTHRCLNRPRIAYTSSQRLNRSVGCPRETRIIHVSSVRLMSAYVSTDRTHPASIRPVYTPASGHKTKTVCLLLSLIGLWTQRPVTAPPASGHSVNPYLFCIGRLWHRRTIHTLRADTPPVKFLTLAHMCQPPSVSPCAHVLAYFHKHFQWC